MKGTYRVIVENKNIKYDFEIKRNITVINGNSATGKTVLVSMIAEYYENGTDSGVLLQCERTCAVLEGRNWKMLLSAMNESIIFIDEGNNFVRTQEFARAIQNTDNYYVIVSRESLPMLPYSITEIYGIRDSGKYGSLKQVYNEMYRIYGYENKNCIALPDCVIVEDSNTGFHFFESLCNQIGIACVSAGGKSKIFALLCNNTDNNVLVIADGAAFGCEIEKVMALTDINAAIQLYLPESFEWLLLNAGIVKSKDLKNILQNTADYVESKNYISWERFFADLLVSITSGNYLAYSKSTLNQVYLQESVKKKILSANAELAFLTDKRER